METALEVLSRAATMIQNNSNGMFKMFLLFINKFLMKTIIRISH